MGPPCLHNRRYRTEVLVVVCVMHTAVGAVQPHCKVRLNPQCLYGGSDVLPGDNLLPAAHPCHQGFRNDGVVPGHNLAEARDPSCWRTRLMAPVASSFPAANHPPTMPVDHGRSAASPAGRSGSFAGVPHPRSGIGCSSPSRTHWTPHSGLYPLPVGIPRRVRLRRPFFFEK